MQVTYLYSKNYFFHLNVDVQGVLTKRNFFYENSDMPT